MTDGIHTVSVPLEVTVIDTNNNKPQFSKPLYQAVLPESVPIGELYIPLYQAVLPESVPTGELYIPLYQAVLPESVPTGELYIPLYQAVLPESVRALHTTVPGRPARECTHR